MADAALPPGLDGDALQRALGIAPFHAWLELRILSSGEGRLEIEMPWRDEIVSNPRIGSAHGGVLASLIDLAGMYAILTQTTAVSATAGLHVDYDRPATAGPIRVRSEVVKLGRTPRSPRPNCSAPRRGWWPAGEDPT
ncbi:hotdog fold thioesterase [uncultured Phenylobacterium sp.]|uniref:hotdog fold thioesterase n=1 Tax=uncultured Phenylobacterium sp. TaxID=349273 RepID=UPI0025CCFFE4|nr:hotdog fold thioesterase [uncultured Phenylobacterium sp.]